MSANKWRDYKRTPKAHSRPLIILIPFGPVEFVYDIADTEGAEIPASLINPFYTKGSISLSILMKLIANIQRDGIKYEDHEMHKANAGYAQATGQLFQVSINRSYEINEKVSTIIHELGHIYCGHLGTNSSSWWIDRSSLSSTVMEIEAESISYLVCKRLDLTTNSESYLSKYIQNNKEVPDLSLDTILVVAGHIESMFKPGFKLKARQIK